MFKAIIVDDEIDIRKGLYNIIEWERQGFTIVGDASNGQEALELFKKEKPSLVLTDIRMPEMDGLELIKNLKTIEPDVKVIILSGYNDFSYAREAMKYGVSNYLLKPVDLEDMNKELKSINYSIMNRLLTRRNEAEKIDSLKNLYLLKLVRDELQDVNALECGREYGLQFEYETMCICTFEISSFYEYETQSTGKEIQLRKFALKNIINEILDKYKCGYLFEESENRYGLLMGTKIETLGLEYFHRILIEAVDCLQQFGKVNILVGMGNMVKSLNSIHASYKQAAKALDRKMFSHSEVIYHFEEIDELREISTLTWTDSHLIQMVSDMNRTLIVKELELLFDEFRQKCISITTVKYMITNILLGLTKIERKYTEDCKKSEYINFAAIDEVLMNGSPQAIQKQIEQVCFEFCSLIEKEKAKNPENMIDKVLLYIYQHYNEEINLKKLADIFFINQFYLGQLIKKKKGMNFNDYLNMIRIDNAKELLSFGSTSIKEVSEKVGYKYVDHFYKNFKELTGANPGEFKKGLGIEEQRV